MFMGLGMPIPDLSNKPGPGRPGWSAGTYDFQFEVTGAVTIKAQPAAAGTFTIKWPNGTEQTTAGSNSIAAPDGTAGVVSINKKTDNTYASVFAIVGGQTNVSQVISWGSNAWGNLSNSFQNCSNLTSLSDTILTTGSTCSFYYAFNDCTSLESVNLTNWDLSKGVNTHFWFEGCSNLEEIDMTNSRISLYSRSDNMFSNIGNSTTNGCLFKASGVDWSSTGNSQFYLTFAYSRIKKDSTFANWVFPSNMSTSISFRLAVLPMQDTTLDCSGWTTYSSTSLIDFQQVNYSYNGYAQPPSSSTGLKIDITNLNVSNVTNIAQSFYYSFQDEVVGLSTLGATNGATSMSIMFAYDKFHKFTATNNFSNAFISSLNLSGSSAFNQTFRSQGNAVPDADASVAPNLSGLDLSNTNGLVQAFYAAKYSNALDFTNVTMNASTSYSFNAAFYACKFLDGGNVNSLFSKTFKVSSLNQAFRSARMGSIIFGSNVDLSPNDSLFLTFYEFGVDIASPTIEFADNVSFANVQNFDRPFFSVGTTNTPLSTCQVDNFIRRLQATRPTAGAITNKTIDFYNSAVTESPSVVRGLADTLVNTGGYILDLFSTDATIPFVYTTPVVKGVDQIPTGSFTGGTFSSSDAANIPVNASTGEIDATNAGNVTIRYTITATGCYNEQALVVADPSLAKINNVYSMEFDGLNDYIDIGSQTFNPNNSISFWINRSTSSSYGTILSASSSYSISIDEGGGAIGVGKFYFRINNVNYTVSSTALATGTWSHVVFVTNGTNVYCYINGVLDKTTTVPAYSTWQYIGAQGAGGGNLFTGKLDEVAIFNTVLTLSQIERIYNATALVDGVVKTADLSALTTPPVKWYRMGD